MFEGEKQVLFWVGLVILALASIILFAVLWQYLYIDIYMNVSWMFRQSFPIIVGGVVFLLIGLYMMKSGIKKP